MKEDVNSFNYAHHIDVDFLNISQAGKLNYYFNAVIEMFSTTDWSYLSALINIGMSSAIRKEMLMSGGTLMSLMVGIADPSPSLIEVSTCMAIFNIEISSVHYFTNIGSFARKFIHPVRKGDATDGNPDIGVDKNYFFRQFDINERNFRLYRFYFDSIVKCLASFYLFDELRKKYPATDVDSPLYFKIFELALNFNKVIFKDSL
jgi:hypothetical protein